MIHKFKDFADLPVGPRRREAVKRYLKQSEKLIGRGKFTWRVSVLAGGIDRSAVCRVMQGYGVSAPITAAILAEEKILFSTQEK